MGAAPMRPPRYNDEQNRRRDSNRRIPPRRPSDPVDEPPRYGVPADEMARGNRPPSGSGSGFGFSHGDRDRLPDARDSHDDDVFDDQGRVDAYGRLRRQSPPTRGGRRSGARPDYPPDRYGYDDVDDPQDQSPYSRLRRPQPQESPRSRRAARGLDWPPAEPSEADWRPSPSRNRRRNSAPTESADDDPYRRRPARRSAPPAGEPDAPAGAGGSGAPRFGAPSWVDQPANEPTSDPWDDEPRDQWPNDVDEGWDSDDLAYSPASPAARTEPPARRARSGYANDATRNEPVEGGEPDEAWLSGEATDDASLTTKTPIEAGEEPEPVLAPDDPRAAVFANPGRITRSGGATSGVRPPVWGLSGYAWRFARRLTIPRTNRLLRFGANRVLPGSTRQRFLAMGIPEQEVRETLGQVRSLNDWAEAWTGTAQRFLGEARRGGDLTPAEAAWDRYLAALCYHVAGFFSFGDERLARTSRSASTTLFLQALGMTMPETRKVNVRWRSKTMPAYLTVPSWANGRRPLVVLLNGTSTTKEETITWQDEFLRQGLAVLALDSPGFGESVGLGPVQLEHDDILDGVFELADADPGLDPNKVAVIGISLGGSIAMRLAAAERRVAAVAAVTPPYEPARWLGASSAVVLAQLAPLFGGYDQLADFMLALDLPETVAAVSAPGLIFGAGHDLVVPPPEAVRLTAAMGEQATLVWFDDGGHALFDAIPEWTREAAEWLAVILDVEDAPVFREPDQADEPDEVEPAVYDQSGAASSAPADDAGTTTMGAASGFRNADTVDQPAAPETDAEANVATGAPPGPASHPRMADRSTEAAAPDAYQPEEHPAGQSDSDFRPLARPGEPAPYAATVFDAVNASERRSEPQRGYDTGAFGPLGPAAARILADEPPPVPPVAPGYVVDRPVSAPGHQPTQAPGPAATGFAGSAPMHPPAGGPATSSAQEQSPAHTSMPTGGPSVAARSAPTSADQTGAPASTNTGGNPVTAAGGGTMSTGNAATSPADNPSAPTPTAPAGRLTDTGSFIPADEHVPFNPIPTADYVSGGTAIRGRHRTSRSFAAVPTVPDGTSDTTRFATNNGSGPRPSTADALFPATPAQPTTPAEPAAFAVASGPGDTAPAGAPATDAPGSSAPAGTTSAPIPATPGSTADETTVGAESAPASAQPTAAPVGVPRMARPAESDEPAADTANTPSPTDTASTAPDADAPFRRPAPPADNG